MYEVVFLSGPRAGAVVPIHGAMDAGRSPECAVEVPDPNVSRRHFRLHFDGVNLHLTDLKSSNGTFLNNERTDAAQIGHGDQIRVGETRMRVQRRAARRERSAKPSSSIFSFREAGGDVSSSLSMSMLQPPGEEQDVDQLAQRLRVIMWVAEQLASIARFDELYGPILETLFEVFPQAERAFLMLGDEYENLHPAAMRRRDGRAAEDEAVSSSLCREALRKKELIVYTEGSDTDFDQGMSLLQLNIRSAMVVPLMVKEEVLGLLVVDTSDRNRSFTESDMALAAAVCRQVAVALKNVLLLEQVESETKTRNNLMRFLPRPVVDQVVQGELDLGLGGTTCRGTIFFADVVGFSSLAERQEPQDVVAMMNAFFDRMVPCIEAEGGAIDKFMGDCVMALWGIPFDQGDSAWRAAVAGLVMQNTLAGLNSLRDRERSPTLAMGVGFESGSVVAGNVGSEDQLSYTVLGDTVNTASRIQATACAHQVLCGEVAWGECRKHVYGVRMPAVAMRNKSEPVTVYSVRGAEAEGEVVLHLPVRVGGERAYLVRRLKGGSFILLHPGACPVGDQRLAIDLVECERIELGVPTEVVPLPNQESDGLLRRTQITLEDRLLGGLLGEEGLVSPRGWEEMRRGEAE